MDDLNPSITFQKICLGKKIEPKGLKLLFLDEIQSSPQQSPCCCTKRIRLSGECRRLSQNTSMAATLPRSLLSSGCRLGCYLLQSLIPCLYFFIFRDGKNYVQVVILIAGDKVPACLYCLCPCVMERIAENPGGD